MSKQKKKGSKQLSIGWILVIVAVIFLVILLLTGARSLREGVCDF